MEGDPERRFCVNLIVSFPPSFSLFSLPLPHVLLFPLLLLLALWPLPLPCPLFLYLLLFVFLSFHVVALVLRSVVDLFFSSSCTLSVSWSLLVPSSLALVLPARRGSLKAPSRGCFKLSVVVRCARATPRHRCGAEPPVVIFCFLGNLRPTMLSFLQGSLPCVLEDSRVGKEHAAGLGLALRSAEGCECGWAWASYVFFVRFGVLHCVCGCVLCGWVGVLVRWCVVRVGFELFVGQPLGVLNSCVCPTDHGRKSVKCKFYPSDTFLREL